jgi:hypothetical protein
MPETL